MNDETDKQRSPGTKPETEKPPANPAKPPQNPQPIKSMIFDHHIQGSEELAKRNQQKPSKKINE